MRTKSLALTFVVALACAPKKDTTQTSTPGANGGNTQTTSAPKGGGPVLDAAALRKHVAFLADDAQEGRAPGTEADGRVQSYVETAMKDAGLKPAFADGYRQRFPVTDGVRVKAGGEVVLDVSGVLVPHAIVPFSSDTSVKGPVVAPLVYVGYGIPRGGKGTGDYAKLEKKVKGAIVVALAGGPDDPHLGQAEKRAASKAIAARDHGAAGFILWDPAAASFPNHGEAADLGVPAVFVGTAGSGALLHAFTGKDKGTDPTTAGVKNGAKSKRPATLQTPVERVVLGTANVAGTVKGSGKSDRVLVIGAHMDHLGHGTDSSLAPGEQAIHNGADDNASGTAVMLELCKSLAKLDASKRPFDVTCIAFGAEEMGLLGSKFYVQSLAEADRKKIAAMINFDMVGRLGPDGLIVAGAGTSKAWPALIDANKHELVVKTTDDGYGPSDHGSFYEAEIPVLHFFTGPHEDYHKPSDDLAKIEFDGAAKVGGFALAIATELEAKTLVPDYVAVARPAMARGGGFKVSLGTIPDYGAKVDGVRLSGVRTGGAAEKAGMRKGDVIVRIGTRAVHNLDDYMAAFAEMKPNETIGVGITRDGKPMDLEMTPQAPKAQ
ncbi:MAG TPA: M28 family peptidase [Nannocystaceae bacterium]|nr:M28 family peptidase [Nannocystaceae bacterium]